MKTIIAVLTTMLLAFATHAADKSNSSDPTAPPPMPKKAKAQKKVLDGKYEQDVTVHYSKNKRIEEYRIKGQLVKVKVIPKRGKEYIIFNNEEWSDAPVPHDLDTQNTPYWKIFSW